MFQCADLVVPLDHSRPGGGNLTLKVLRRPALTGPGTEVLVKQPGGPGQSGRNALLHQPKAQPDLTLVAFDPRGVAASEGVRCFRSPEEEAAFWGGRTWVFPMAAAQEPEFAAKRAEFVRHCRANGGAKLRHLSTVNVARDLDLLRAALGQRTLRFWGSSYATYLGVVYANLFPHRVRTMALTAVVDPEQWARWPQGASSAGTSATWEEFLRACAAAGDRCALAAGGADPKRVAEDRLTALRANPDRYALTVATISNQLYDRENWSGLAKLLVGQPVGSARGGAAQLPEGTSEQFLAVACTDGAIPRQPGLWPRLAAAADRRGELFGRMWLHLVDACAHWPTAADRYAGPWGRPTAPILLLNNRNDPTTPLAGARNAERLLANAWLAVVDGAGHSPGSSAAIHSIENYLRTGDLPPRGTVFPVDKPPFS
ncbi:pimeloyl-ACP methyl ester carboxylesterase [Crossiella equi]|uniref:Pimeloyl-ACP methyl ester carboxylesterase n=1 Tax=Crossiella equi TaxID=130796 RepID=A0ABS5AJQ8_9PSEU|nr:alpha/beta hydrolase [Crossiella equi]MBP2476804.1 pimeloyl-ACP methyl ester carboxylesterase [Crossiella equi]